MDNTAYSNVPLIVLLGALNVLIAILFVFNVMAHLIKSAVNAHPISICIKILVQLLVQNTMMINWMYAWIPAIQINI